MPLVACRRRLRRRAGVAVAARAVSSDRDAPASPLASTSSLEESGGSAGSSSGSSGSNGRGLAAAAATSSTPSYAPVATFNNTTVNNFSSSSAADIADGDDGCMGEYAALKASLLDTTRTSAGAIGLYLLLTVDGAAALAAMLGAAASYYYLTLLCRAVDKVSPSDTVPIWEANRIETVWLRRAAKVRAAYGAALTPRLLVPAGLGALVGLYGGVTGERAPLAYVGSLLLGFLSYKVALLLKLVDDLTPKSFAAKEGRPAVEPIDDELDQWGRPKRRQQTPIDAMPEEQRAKAYKQLEKDLAREERRRNGGGGSGGGNGSSVEEDG